MTYEQILELLARIDQLNADELAELNAAILALFEEASATEPATTESVALMQQLNDARGAVDAEVAARDEAQATLDQQAEELRQQFNQEPEQADEPAEPQADEPQVDEPQVDEPAEPQVDEPAEPAEPQAEVPAQPVAAGARPAPVPLVRLNRQRPPTNRAQRRQLAAGLKRRQLLASGDLTGISAGAELADWAALAEPMARKIEATKRGGNGEWSVASLEWEYEDAHTLDGNNTDEKITAAIVDHKHRTQALATRLQNSPDDRDALVAAGGLCAPLTPYYDLLVLAQAARPVRDSLVQFGATRGGVSFITPPKLGDLDSAVTKWTIQNDSDATAGTPTKPCVRVACGTPVSEQIYAVPLCLEFGNIGARTFPEQVAANNELGLATHARFAESALLTAIDTHLTAVTNTDTYGAARATLSDLSIMRAGLISRQRMSPNTMMRVVLSWWVREWIRTDIARQLATDTSEGNGGALAVTDAEIDNMLAVRGINVTWHQDGAAGERFGTQSAGALVKFPTTAIARMWPEGSFLFLDGGRLDVGIIRDSTLVATNDYKTFFETFEGLAFVGVEGLKLTLTAGASGASSGTVTAAAA